jgi:hypothetical protein
MSPPHPLPQQPAHQPRRRWARGPARPQYLQPADVDQVLAIVIALMSEVSSLRDRIDTHELLAADGVVATTAAVEGHQLSAAQRSQREQRRQALLKRTLRVLTEHSESAGAHLAGQVSDKL